jgi:hypothetical protein
MFYLYVYSSSQAVPITRHQAMQVSPLCFGTMTIYHHHIEEPSRNNTKSQQIGLIQWSSQLAACIAAYLHGRWKDGGCSAAQRQRQISAHRPSFPQTSPEACDARSDEPLHLLCTIYMLMLRPALYREAIQLCCRLKRRSRARGRGLGNAFP